MQSDRAVLHKVILRMQRVHVSQCFDTWWLNVDYLKQVRRKLQRCLVRIMHRCLVYAFEKWLSFVDEQRDLRYSVRIADAQWKKCVASKYFSK